METMTELLIKEYTENPDRPISGPLSQLLVDLGDFADAMDDQIQFQAEEINRLKSELAEYRKNSERTTSKKKRKTCDKEPLAEPDRVEESKANHAGQVPGLAQTFRATGATKDQAITVYER